MENIEVEVLLVEDNPSDAELTIRALKKNNLANKVYQVPRLRLLRDILC